ncbi:Transposon TX1 uncharacterized 149 kDa protein [Vitis vinifera]|uniref:Transposon TX1 uncharacterized 149 kDa protein n=1 Tax=Vitis vinifera TaxID=29760 RepID=A0A438HV01_VITVI|nr:Transposon TX1 uncharacterized 149 kDa protein [Vitis vinifera]
MGDQLGLRQVSNLGRATVDGLGHLQKGKSILNQAHVVDNGPLLKIFSPGLTDKNRNAFMEHEFINYRVEEIGRRQQSVPPSQDTEKMLEEEAARYGLDVNLGGLRVQGASSSNSFCFGRSPEKEGYDHSGMQREGAVIGSGSRNPNKIGWMADQTEPQEGSKEDQLNWEESSLVRFSQFLGFSTEGLEVEILNFLDKIRKRKEKIIGKGFLEASRFERELKRLECSVNYEREAKKKGPMKGRGNQKVVIRSQKVDLFCLQETKVQVMSDEMVRSLGPGRFLDWKVLNAKGTAGEDKEGLWEELGAIRGLWEEPWCLGGDFNITLYLDDRNRTGRITSAMRRFAQIIDELGLVDIPLQGGSFTWSGGLNNQTRARLDRFLATPCWLDQFSSLKNMWLKAEGFQELIKGWWQGIEVSGRPSYRLATKLKGLKQNLKTWNKEVFGRLEKNKADALQQVESWILWKNLEGDERGQSPGPDGFTLAFWQNSWETVKEDLLGLFKEFHDQNSFIKSLNHTFLVLIPKKGGVEDLGDYRPISLLGSLYKLLAKVLANRIKKVIGKVISPDQNAFIKGRQILDGSLSQMRSCKRWAWIKMDRMDVGDLSRAAGIWRDREQAVKVTHLLFADDTIIFCEAKKEALLHLGWVLFWFEAASGLKINLDKSMVIPVGRWMGCWIWRLKLGVGWGNSLLVYLGLPLGAPNRDVSAWDGVEDENAEKAIPLETSISIQRRSFGKKVLEAKYGKEEFGWRTRKANGAFGVGVWKEILKESTWCWENMGFKVGKGSRIRFWTDLWCGNSVLSHDFPNLFSMAAIGMSQWRNAGIRIRSRRVDLRLLRDLNDWEVGLVGNILAVLRDYSVTMEEDAVCWKKGEDGLFKIKYAYNVLANSHGWISLIAMFGWAKSQPKLPFCLGSYLGESPHVG